MLSKKLLHKFFRKSSLSLTLAAIAFTLTTRGSQAQNLIAVTDQTTGNPQILVMDYAQTDWSTTNPSAVAWSWKPADSGMSTTGWTLPNEARLRSNCVWGGQYMATVSGGGLIAVVSYPGKVKKWSFVLPSSDNVHGVEILPNGNVAVAAPAGSYVRIYTASQGSTSTGHSADFTLNQAHNVIWDPSTQLLWALGDNAGATAGRLVGLRVGGTSAAPTLTLAVDVPITNACGHDVEPVYGDTDSLYLTTGAKTWIYTKSTNSVALYQGGVCCRKSINMQLATNELVETQPQSGAPCPSSGTWCTQHVDFYSPTTPFALTTTRTRTGAMIYRSRVWVPDYQ